MHKQTTNHNLFFNNANQFRFHGPWPMNSHDEQKYNQRFQFHFKWLLTVRWSVKNPFTPCLFRHSKRVPLMVEKPVFLRFDTFSSVFSFAGRPNYFIPFELVCVPFWIVVVVLRWKSLLLTIALEIIASNWSIHNAHSAHTIFIPSFTYIFLPFFFHFIHFEHSYSNLTEISHWFQ